MGNKKTSLTYIVLYVMGAVAVIWFSMLIAPYVDGGLISVLGGISEALEEPFNLAWTDSTLKTIVILLSIYVLAILIYLSDTRATRHGEEYGSAKWGSVRQLNRKFATRDSFNNKILTQNVRMGWDGHKHKRNLNTVVIGGAGAGKSQFFAILNILQGKTSLIVTDPSGELLRATGWFLKYIAKYKVKVLDFLNIEKSDCYNPFCYIRTDDDILKIADILFKNTTPKDSKAQDPFWDNSAKILLEALMFYLWHEVPEDEQNFTMVMDMIRAGDISDDENYSSPLDILFERLEMRNPEHIAVKYYKDYHKGAADTIRSVQATLISHMSKFNMESMQKLTMVDEMNLASLGEEKTAIFMIIPETDTSYNFLPGMLYMQAFNESYMVADKKYKGRLPIPIHCLMDEFANVILPDDFEKIISTCRKRNICVSIILQGITQLQALYKDQWQAIMGNCDELLYMGSNEKECHKYISEMLGKQTISFKTFGRNKGHSGSSSSNQQLTGRELMSPEEVRLLDEDKAILFIKSCRPVIDFKYNPAKHPNAKYNTRFGGIPYEHGKTDKALKWNELDEKFNIDGEYQLLTDEEVWQQYVGRDKAS